MEPKYFRRKHSNYVMLLLGPFLLILILRFFFTLAEQKDNLVGITLEQVAKANLNVPVDLGIISGLCVLVAFLTSSVLQILKEQTGFRANVNHTALGRWFEQRLSLPFFVSIQEFKDETEEQQCDFFYDPSSVPSNMTLAMKMKTDARFIAQHAEFELEELCAAASPSLAFYNLPAEQFCGQIATGIDLVILSPAEYSNCFAAITSGRSINHQAATSDFHDYMVTRENSMSPEGDKFDRLRVRIMNYAHRALDGLQLEAIRLWKRQLLFTSIHISFGLSLAIAAIIAFPAEANFTGIIDFIYVTSLCGIAGALLSPLAYDFMSAIRGIGGR